MEKSGTFWRQRRKRGHIGEPMVGGTDLQSPGGKLGSARGEGRADTATATSGGSRARGRAMCPEGPGWHGGLNANKKQKDQQDHRGPIRKPSLGTFLSSLHNESRKHQNKPVSTVFPPQERSLPSPVFLAVFTVGWIQKKRVGGVAHPTFM